MLDNQRVVFLNPQIPCWEASLKGGTTIVWGSKKNRFSYPTFKPHSNMVCWKIPQVCPSFYGDEKMANLCCISQPSTKIPRAFSHHRLGAIWSPSHFEEDHTHLRPLVAGGPGFSNWNPLVLEQFAMENDPLIDAKIHDLSWLTYKLPIKYGDFLSLWNQPRVIDGTKKHRRYPMYKGVTTHSPPKP